jgi:RNA polymerase sigma-70 factor, ECF subfamily
VLLEKAFNMHHIGSYQIQAAISAVHARSASPELTDWREIAGLYEQLRRISDTAIIRLNQAVAVSMFAGPQQGLDLLHVLSDELDGYAPFHLACADMHLRLGQPEQARQAYTQALELTHNQPERDFILEQIKAVKGGQELS